MALADLEVRLVVRGRHLEHAGAELEIHMLVADDGDELLLARQLDGQWSHDVPADEMRVTRVLGIHGHCGVAGDGLGARGGDGEPDFAVGSGAHRGVGGGLVCGSGTCGRAARAPGGVGHLDLEVIHETLLRFHFHFLVGQRGLRGRAPVHHALAAVDEALLVKLDEDFLHAAHVVGVHRETFAGPVAGAAEFLELRDDDAAVLFLPRPHALDELLAPDVLLGLLFLLAKLLGDHALGGDARVVGAGEPEDFLAVHARLAAENVLDGVVEHVPHVEHARDIRRRDDDGKCRALLGNARGIGGEAALLQPEIIPFVLNGLGLVGLGNFGHGARVLRPGRGFGKLYGGKGTSAGASQFIARPLVPIPSPAGERQ